MASGREAARAAKRIFAARAREGGPAGATAPDAVLAGGEEALRIIERADFAASQFPADKIYIFDGECDREVTPLTRWAQKVAARLPCRLLRRTDGCPVAVAAAANLFQSGDLVLTVGLGSPASGSGVLYWPVTAAELEAVIKEGSFVPGRTDVHRVVCRGGLSGGVTGADVGLYIASQFGPAGGRGATLEFAGPLADALSGSGREALAAAVALSGPQAVLYAQGEDTFADAVYEYDFTPLVPQVARVGASEWVINEVEEFAGAPLSHVILGPASMEDIAVAAEVLGGAAVSSEVTLWVFPASRTVHFAATGAGYLAALLEAGATILPYCTLPWPEEVGATGEEAVVVTHRCALTAVAGKTACAFLTSVPTAAASALAGELCDPRPLFKK